MRAFAHKLILCLVLGVLTTIIVAWTCALLVTPQIMRSNAPWYGVGYVEREDVRWWFGRKQGFGSIEMNWSAVHLSPASQPSPTNPNAKLFPYWSVHDRFIPERLSDDAQYQIEFIEEARGWPLVALRSWRKVHTTGVVGNATGALQYLMMRNTLDQAGRVELRGWMKRSPVDDRSLPLLPVWPGFLADTAIFTAAWFALLASPHMLRGGVRRLRGRCPRCAYQLRGGLAGGCPECGWRRSRN
jgi:hypothetical protein